MKLKTLAPLLVLLSLCVHATAQADPPKPAAVLLGNVDTYTPVSTVTRSPLTLTLPGSFRNRLESVSNFPIDRYGTHLDQSFEWLPEVRLGAKLESSFENSPIHLLAEYEQDVTTYTAVGATDVAGERLPNGRELHSELRKGYLRADLGKFLVIGGGYMTSHWGLGLLANDGAHGWTPGSARFSDPRSGDRVLRGFVRTQPLTDYGVVASFAYDGRIHDDVTLSGDSATQWIFSLRAGDEKKATGGIYVVYRQQDSTVGRGFDAWVVDLMESASFDLEDIGLLTIAAEGALITGETRLGPTPDVPRHDLFQLAGTIDVRLDRGGHGGVLSVLYASGDQNFDDKQNNAFKVDPNYEFGMLLFRQVIAAQTGRAPVTAGDPNLVGRPVPDLDRVPTGGSPTNTIAFFPRGWLRSQNGLEAYAGPLFALSEVNYTDPLSSRLEGGAPHNPLGGAPSHFYGVELDAGTRYRMLLHGTELTVGLEGGVLFPGNAFRQLDGDRMGEVLGLRAMVDYRL